MLELRKIAKEKKTIIIFSMNSIAWIDKSILIQP